MTAPNGSLASKEFVLSIPDLAHEDVPVPEWNGAVVRLRELGATEVMAYQQSLVSFGAAGADGRPVPTVSASGLVDAQARLVALSAVDHTGALLFAPEDVAKLGKKSRKAIERLYRVASRLSGISAGEAEGEATVSTEAASPSSDSVLSSESLPPDGSSPS